MTATSTAKTTATSPFDRVLTLEDILTTDLEPPRWIVEGLVLEQSATLASGHPRAGKSLNLLAAAMEAVIRGKVWNHFDARSVKRTLFIETEDPECVVRERVRGFAKGLGVDPKDVPPGFHVVCPGPFSLLEVEVQLRKLFEDVSPDFAVISTLQGLLNGRNWKEQHEMAPISAMFVRLARECCPIVVITHSPWDEEQKRAAGTVTLTANFPNTVHFSKRIKDGATRTEVLLDSKLGNREPSFHLELKTEGKEARRVVYAGSVRVPVKERIIEEIARDPHADPTTIADRADCSPEYVRRLMKKPA